MCRYKRPYHAKKNRVDTVNFRNTQTISTKIKALRNRQDNSHISESSNNLPQRRSLTHTYRDAQKHKEPDRLARTSVLAFLSAPASSSSRTHLTWPCMEAPISAVYPSCARVPIESETARHGSSGHQPTTRDNL
jgi:hypothetical protein